MRGELSDRQAKLCRFIVRNAFEGSAKLSLAQIATGLRWEWGEDTLLRELKALRPAWITFESKQGQRGPYLIRLMGLKVLREGDELPLSELGPKPPTSARPPHDLRKIAPQEPPHVEVGEAVERGSQSGEQPPQEPPQTSVDSPLNSYLYEGSEVEASSEVNLDHVVGKTTVELVSVEQADDGSLVWSGEQQEGEQGLLDDFQALVDAGLGEWRENDAEGKR
jgi:hypothetical protein